MKGRTKEHLLAMLIVTLLMVTALVLLQNQTTTRRLAEKNGLGVLSDLDFSDFNDAFHRTLLIEVMDRFFPDEVEANRQQAEAFFEYKQSVFLNSLQRVNQQEDLTVGRFFKLMGMYLKFLFIYMLVMILTYYAVQTVGSLIFITRKQTFEASRSVIAGKARFQWIGRQTLTLSASFLLFSPAYVIAYSIRTEFNTDSLPFLVMLGVISNGLLIMYATKFHTFLVAESRKGYVETALAKNLKASWQWNTKNGIALKSLLKPVKDFKGHLFDPIYRNARYQYLSSIREQAAYVITGLIIIEMALNIHGHLSYEMLRQLLYKNYSVVVMIVLCIFYTVKFTEVAADYLTWRENRKYANE